MAENPQHIYLVRTAHMHRKLETGKRHISAPRVSLENGTYLPPIYRTIALRVKRRREKEHRAYAYSVSLLTETWGARIRIRDGAPSPFSLPRHFSGAQLRKKVSRGERTRLANRTRACGHSVTRGGGARACLRHRLRDTQAAPFSRTDTAALAGGFLDKPPLSRLRPRRRGSAGTSPRTNALSCTSIRRRSCHVPAGVGYEEVIKEGSGLRNERR